VTRRRTFLAAIILAGLGLLGWTALRAVALPKVPTYTVSRGPYRNEVLAYGLLQAQRSTPVTVPNNLQRPMRVAWLAPAGAVKQNDVVVIFDASEVEKQYEDGRSDRASAESKMRKARSEGDRSSAALGLDLTLAQEELKRAEDVAPTDAAIFSRNQILESSLDRGLLQKRVQTNDAKKMPVERLAAADFALADIERKKAALKVTQAEQSLKSLKVLAPHDGTLVYPLYWRGDGIAIGDTAWPSQTVAELPDLSTLEAKVFVLEGDGGSLAVDRKAVVEIEGQPGLVFEAKVRRVDAVAKTRDRQSPVKYFEVALTLDKSQGAGLKPGQRVRATILIDDLADVVAVPRGALFEKDGRRLVYRFEDGRFRPVEVVVGRRSLGRVVIEKGVGPGDRIALADPERREGSGATPASTGPSAAATSR
jgi:RND family efflux transporter MFP subunit